MDEQRLVRVFSPFDASLRVGLDTHFRWSLRSTSKQAANVQGPQNRAVLRYRARGIASTSEVRPLLQVAARVCMSLMLPWQPADSQL